MGMSGDTALIQAKRYVDKTLKGQGALKGQDGFSPTITENAYNTDKIYKLDITTANSAFTTPNLRGKDGEGSGGGETNVIESISVNGTPISVDENKNVDITVPEAYDDTAIKAEIAKKADTTSIPRKVSVLENDSKYQTESDVTTTLSDYATKTYVGEQIANAEHLKREIVTVLPSDTEASDNIIYMMKVESATGNDKYQEYMKIDGTVQMVGDTSVDLTDYAKTTDIPTTLPANGGNSDTVNNHTVETDVPVDAKFTDTIYDDTEVKGSIAKLNSNLSNKTKLTFELGDISLIDGSSLDYTDCKRSGFIKVTPNTKYTLNRTQTKYMNIIGYKEDKSVITDGINPDSSAIVKGCKTAEYEFTTTPTTNYIRIAIIDTNLSENITLTNNGIGNTVVELVEDVDELKNDLGTKLNVFKDENSVETFEIPTPRNYGTVIVLTAYDIFSLIYESNGTVKHQKITSFYENRSISSASFSNTDRKITITFNNQMWSGIKAIFQ